MKSRLANNFLHSFEGQHRDLQEENVEQEQEPNNVVKELSYLPESNKKLEKELTRCTERFRKQEVELTRSI